MQTTRSIKIKLIEEKMMADFFFAPDAVSIAREAMQQGKYREIASFNFSQFALAGEAAAEWCFELTNNPSREDDRQLMYGRHRSVSSGDIVEVDGVNWLCCSLGWQQV